MNQILATEKKAKKTKSPVEIEKIVRFFCIAIIVFGVVLVGQGSYGAVQEAKIAKEQEKNANKGTLPNVTIEREDNYIIVNVTHDKAISEIVYNWNGSENNVITGNGRQQMLQDIELPVGNNTLNLKVKDIDGVEITYTKSYVVSDIDSTKPEITLTVIGNYLKIIATDNVEMSYVTYRWNEDQEVKVDVDPTSPTKIETQVELPKGENKITVNAVDATNNMQTKEQKIKGITKPTIEVYQNPDYLQYVVIKVTDQEAVKVVDVVLNGKSYRLDFGERAIYEHWLELAPGQNSVYVKAYNVQGASKEFNGQCTYTP